MSTDSDSDSSTSRTCSRSGCSAACHARASTRVSAFAGIASESGANTVRRGGAARVDPAADPALPVSRASPGSGRSPVPSRSEPDAADRIESKARRRSRGVSASDSTRSGRLAPAARSRRARSSILARLSRPRSRARSVSRSTGEPARRSGALPRCRRRGRPGRPGPGRTRAGRGAGLFPAPPGRLFAVRRRRCRGRGLVRRGRRLRRKVGIGPADIGSGRRPVSRPGGAGSRRRAPRRRSTGSRCSGKGSPRALRAPLPRPDRGCVPGTRSRS